MALTATAAKAQYMIDSLLPRPVATEATNVTATGYTANWRQLEEDEYLGTKAIGFYVRTYATHTAQKDGERFYLINTDFSYLKNMGGTEEQPVTPVNQNNMFVRGTIGAPERPATWITANQAYAGETLCLDGKYNLTYCNGQLMLNITDLSNGGGDVHFKFKCKTDGLAKTLGVYLRMADTDEADDVIDKKIISDLDNEWREVEFTLHGGQKVSDIIIKGEDLGNLVSMFYFIDDLQVWQELKKGETASVLYNDDFLMDNIEASSYDMKLSGLYADDGYAFGVSSYDLNSISVESNHVDIPLLPSGIGGVKADETASPDTPVTVYSLSGAVVAKGTAAHRPALAKGTWVVKTGSKVKKVTVK